MARVMLPARPGDGEERVLLRPESELVDRRIVGVPRPQVASHATPMTGSSASSCRQGTEADGPL